MPKELSGDLRVKPLASAHDRAHFFCGAENLDTYLRAHAGQDIRRKAKAVFVLVGAAHPLLSATLIGRLAIAKHSQGRGLGSILLAQALQKAYESASTVGSSMVVVDAVSEAVCEFYAAHGFVRLPQSMRMVLPVSSIGILVGR